MTTTNSPEAQSQGGELLPIYVASRASLPERGQMWRAFRSLGYRITSSWIDEDGEGATGDFGELWLRIANEIRQSVALVLYAEAADFPLKGALTEAGLALGMGKSVFVCLPDLGVLPPNYRPIGSWIAHPLVTRCDDISVAMKLAALTRADLPRATADGPVTTYKDKRQLTGAERFNWRKVYNDYTFNNCDHEHDGYPNHLVCAECAFELLAHFATPHATGETTVEAALVELREMFTVTRERQWMIEVGVQDLASDFFVGRSVIRYVIKLQEGDKTWTGESLDDCMAQVRAATHTEGSEKSLDE